MGHMTTKVVHYRKDFCGVHSLSTYDTGEIHSINSELSKTVTVTSKIYGHDMHGMHGAANATK